ncbi:putative tail completion protein [Caudoviricetes sp.]|nr:putative tail completion protein [Caudoviricetes sp.]
MIQSLTLNTPVDTSQALSNWVVGLGNVDPSFIDPWVPGEKGSTRTQSAGEALKIAKLIIRDKKPGQTLYISNSAPYIIGLEEETISRQPGRMVAKALIIARVQLHKKAAK